MPWTNKHLQWLAPAKVKVVTSDGHAVSVFDFKPNGDAAVMSAWAKHFRNHYCLDTQIDALRKGTPHSRAEYLKAIKFPDEASAPGPSIRSGDFAEILVADYLQFVLKYWVPRTRYVDKKVRNESSKGSDILGFKIVNKGKQSKKDELAIYEAKAQLTGTSANPRLQNAIDDSVKDEMRKAESLNAIKQRYLDAGHTNEVTVIERFQNQADHPYTAKSGAVALFSMPAYCPKTIAASKADGHPNAVHLSLIVIRGDDLMALVHQLYLRAADEA
jgi:Cap4 SAVED domain